MSAPTVFEVAESTRLDVLLLVARHLRRQPLLPDPRTITVDRVWQCVRVQLLPEPDRELGGLLTWHETLRAPVAEAWRAAEGSRLIASTLGQTGDDLPVQVFTGMEHDEALFMPVVEPDTGRPMTGEELERAATVGLRRTAWPGPGTLETTTVVTGSTEVQADGLACVMCGADYLRGRLARAGRPVAVGVAGVRLRRPLLDAGPRPTCGGWWLVSTPRTSERRRTRNPGLWVLVG